MEQENYVLWWKIRIHIQIVHVDMLCYAMASFVDILEDYWNMIIVSISVSFIYEKMIKWNSEKKWIIIEKDIDALVQKMLFYKDL